MTSAIVPPLHWAASRCRWLIACALIATWSQAQAQWRISFVGQQVRPNSHNIAVLKLLPQLQQLERASGSKLLYLFETQQHADDRWQQFILAAEQYGAIVQRDYQVHRKPFPSQDTLNIQLQPLTGNSPCPGVISLSDPAWQIEHWLIDRSQTLISSPEAWLEFRSDGEIHYQYHAFSHQPDTQQYRDISQIKSGRTKVQLGEVGEDYLFIAAPAFTQLEILSTLQTGLHQTHGHYTKIDTDIHWQQLVSQLISESSASSKGAGLNPIPYDPEQIVFAHSQTQEEKLPGIAACHIRLIPKQLEHF